MRARDREKWFEERAGEVRMLDAVGNYEAAHSVQDSMYDELVRAATMWPRVVDTDLYARRLEHLYKLASVLLSLDKDSGPRYYY